MFLEERHKAIVEHLTVSQTATVQYFAERFSVSKETIRKDLTLLANKGILTRCHGGAMLLKRKMLSGITTDNQHHIEQLLPQYKRKPNKIQKGQTIRGKVCILGSFNVDIVAHVARFPQGGESIMAQKSMIGPGGKGSNQALAASNAEAEVHFVAKVGKDQFSQFAYDHLSSSAIDSFTLYQSDSVPTGNAVIYVAEDNAENMIAIYSGANLTFTDEEISELTPHLKQSDLLLVQLENNMAAITKAVQIAKQLDVITVLNPAPFSDAVIPLLPYIDIITPNESEASLLSGVIICDLVDAQQAAAKIHDLGARTVIITLGNKGALLFDGNHYHHISAFPSVAVDTTGAGDAFNGALCASLARGESIYYAVNYASAFASLAVEREGASNMPTHKSVLQRLVTQHNDKAKYYDSFC